MIAIIDNGQSYSDHSVYFIEATPKQAELLKAVFALAELERAYKDNDERSSLVGVVSKIEWYGGLTSAQTYATDLMRELRSPISPAMVEVLARLGHRRRDRGP